MKIKNTAERRTMDTTKKFSGKAQHYTESRPTYSMELVDCMFGKYGLTSSSVIADIGSGTGKFSKHLLDRGSEVYCIEPNEDMRCMAETELGGYKNFHSIAGDAENTSLKNEFADCITTAQAFHWFDVTKFKRECLRIIKPGGKVFLIWNIRDSNDDINQEWHNVFYKFCPDFCGFSNGIQRDDIKVKAFFDKGYEYAEFENPLIFDRDGFIKRSLSSSYSLKENDTEYKEYIFALNELFDKHENDGLISIANHSVAYIGSIK